MTIPVPDAKQPDSLAEERLRQLSTVAETAQQDAVIGELRQVIECLPQAIALLDEHNRLILWNRNYEAMFPESAPHVKPGASIESLYRNAFERISGLSNQDQAHRESWVRERMDRLDRSASYVE